MSYVVAFCAGWLASLILWRIMGRPYPSRWKKAAEKRSDDVPPLRAPRVTVEELQRRLDRRREELKRTDRLRSIEELGK